MSKSDVSCNVSRGVSYDEVHELRSAATVPLVLLAVDGTVDVEAGGAEAGGAAEQCRTPLAGGVGATRLRAGVAKVRAINRVRKQVHFVAEQAEELSTPAGAVGEQDAVELPNFRPILSIFVFPNLPLLGVWIFTAGLTSRAVSLLAFEITLCSAALPDPPAAPAPPGAPPLASTAWLAPAPLDETSGGAARSVLSPSCSVKYAALAVAVLLMTVGALILGLCMLVHFYRRHVADGHPSWKNAARAPNWKLVQDPLFKLSARVQSAFPVGCCAKGAKHPLQRKTGGWQTDPEDTVEPARTERILARPFTVFWSKSSDGIDSMSLGLFIKVRGNSFLGLLFSWMIFAVQMVLGTLVGLAPYLGGGATGARIVMLTTFGIKSLWAVQQFLLSPCACLLSNLVLTMQLTTECLGLGALFFADATLSGVHLGSAADYFRSAAEWSMLLPIFYPVAMKAYDAIVVNLIANFFRRKLSCAEIGFTFTALIAHMPALMQLFVGFETNDKEASAIPAVVVLGTKMKALVVEVADKLCVSVRCCARCAACFSSRTAKRTSLVEVWRGHLKSHISRTKSGRMKAIDAQGHRGAAQSADDAGSDDDAGDGDV